MTSETNSTSHSPSPSRFQWLLVFGILAACFALNISTCRLHPASWMDEVSFSEPAINFVQTGHFVTRVWPYQPNNTFPTVNCPLYSLSLAGWLSATGTSLLATRAFNYSLIGLAGILGSG